MKKLIALILIFMLMVSALPALADGSVYLKNDEVSILTIAQDEWQGNESYWLVQVHTGINTTRQYQIILPDGFVAIVECLNLNGTENGHLVAYDGNQTIEVTVGNGVVGLCTKAVAKELFTERWMVLETNNWARKDVRPLPSWNWTKPTK